MKKTVSLVLVFIFAFALVLQLPALANDGTGPNVKATSSLEKISSPSLMNLYREIRKIGDDLFGVKKASSTTANIQKNDGKKASSTAVTKLEELKKAGLEKIISLEQVKFFEKITKVGNDLFGIKKKGAAILPTMTADLITCVSAAIDAKDTSISVSFTNASSETTSAIEARGTCQKSALALTSGRDDALKTCNKTFQEATKTANTKAKGAQQEAWTVYKTSLKACSTAANTTEINIEDGGEILK